MLVIRTLQDYTFCKVVKNTSTDLHLWIFITEENIFHDVGVIVTVVDPFKFCQNVVSNS